MIIIVINIRPINHIRRGIGNINNDNRRGSNGNICSNGNNRMCGNNDNNCNKYKTY